MKTLAASMLAAVIAMAAAQASAATVSQIASPAGLPGAVTVEDFEDTTFAAGFTASGSAGTPVLAPAAFYSSGVTPSGSEGLGLGSNGLTPMTLFFDFAAPVRFGGLWFGNDDDCCSVAGLTGFLDVYSAGGLEGTLSLLANRNDEADQFLGFSTDFDVTRIGYRMNNRDLALYVDDLQFGSSAAPEPMAWALMLLGFAGVGGMVRRRRAVIAA